MIADNIINLAEGFRGRVADVFDNNVRLALDFSWPSVGICDLVSFSLRGERPLEETDRFVFRTLAAYLGLVVYPCWDRFCSEVILDVGKQGVFIKGVTRQGKPLSVDIETAITSVLQKTASTVGVLGRFERAVVAKDNLLSPVVLGMALGLSPYGQGACLTETPESFAENIQDATKMLALSSAVYYGHQFANESLGQVAELYMHNLIYPPILMMEGLPALEGSAGILNFAREYKISEKQMLDLTSNLMLVPDDLISLSAAAYQGAITDVVTPQMYLMRDIRTDYIGLLRTAMLNIRECLGKGEDWILRNEFDEDARKRLNYEKIAGFLPWVQLDENSVARKEKDGRIGELLKALAGFDLNESTRILDVLITEEPGEVMFGLQKIYLDLRTGNNARVMSFCRLLATEPKGEDNYLLYYYWGRAELKLGNANAGFRHFEKSMSLCPSDSDDYCDIVGHIAFASQLLGEMDKAERFYQLAEQADKRKLLPLLTYYQFLRNQKRLDEAKEVQRRLLDCSPLDRNVISQQFDIKAL